VHLLKMMITWGIGSDNDANFQEEELKKLIRQYFGKSEDAKEFRKKEAELGVSYLIVGGRVIELIRHDESRGYVFFIGTDSCTEKIFEQECMNKIHIMQGKYPAMSRKIRFSFIDRENYCFGIYWIMQGEN